MIKLNFRSLVMSSLYAMSLMAGGGPVAAQEPIGIVVEVKGSFMLVEPSGMQTKAQVGGVVHNGTRLRSLTKSSRLSIAFFDGSACTTSQILSSHDKIPDLCPGVLTEKVKTDLLLKERIMRAFQRLFDSPEDSYVSTLSRGKVGILKESVLELRITGVDLSPAVELLASPTGGGLLVQRRAGNGVWATIGEVSVSTPGETPILKADALSPGLYRLLQLSGGEAETVEGEAWVLLASGIAFQHASEAFARASLLESGWNLRTEIKRRWLRAYMECLAEETAKASGFENR